VKDAILKALNELAKWNVQVPEITLDARGYDRLADEVTVPAYGKIGGMNVLMFNGPLGPTVIRKEVKMRSTGLTIQEAIKSGKPFRRPHWSNEKCFFTVNHIANSTLLSLEDILADDWEVKREPRKYYLHRGIAFINKDAALREQRHWLNCGLTKAENEVVEVVEVIE
jgi:hypothetical protein